MTKTLIVFLVFENYKMQKNRNLVFRDESGGGDVSHHHARVETAVAHQKRWQMSVQTRIALNKSNVKQKLQFPFLSLFFQTNLSIRRSDTLASSCTAIARKSHALFTEKKP
jgi:hypothetical protein